MSEAFEKWLRATCFQKPTDDAYDLAKSAYTASLERAADIAEGVPNEWKAKGWVVESSASSMSKDIAAAIRKEMGE